MIIGTVIECGSLHIYNTATVQELQSTLIMNMLFFGV